MKILLFLNQKGNNMISLKEMLCGVELSSIPEEHQKNLLILLDRINKVRLQYNKPMTPTNSYRTMEHHLEIYAKKGITDQSKIPMKSKHLTGEAVDIYDPNLEITAWLKENDSQRLKDVLLWCEEGNSNWVHFQIIPPKSGNLWFLP